jgi:CheY-like chemotaxis protein
VTHWIPQFALVDVHLPGLSRIDLAILLKAGRHDCKISLISAQPSTFDLLEADARDGHVFEILAKPVHLMGLLSVAAERLGSVSSVIA